MATRILDPGGGLGFRSWRMTRDEAGYREYKLDIQVEGAVTDGPGNVLRTAGLPLPGTPWIVRNDIDLWAWCRPNCTVKPRHAIGEATRVWDLEFTFSNKPNTPQQNRCHDLEIEDPLLEPQKISGSFVKEKKEATHDKDGEPILTSSHEVIRGPQVEFDDGYHTVRIEQNVIALQLGLLASMVNTLNSAPLWGVSQTAIKFESYSWERKFHGLCSIYYTRVLEFGVRPAGTWDRDILDEGTKALNGHWGDGGAEGSGWVLDTIDGNPPNPNNPAHFKRFQDRDGNPCRVVLDGFGKPINSDTAAPGEIHVEYYPESNFLLLGVPLTF